MAAASELPFASESACEAAMSLGQQVVGFLGSTVGMGVWRGCSRKDNASGEGK